MEYGKYFKQCRKYSGLSQKAVASKLGIHQSNISDWENNVVDYLNAGAVGIGVGSAICNKKLIEEGKYDEITKISKIYVDALSACAK